MAAAKRDKRGSEKSRSAGPDLLALAFELIAEHGWRGFTFADLAERAGLSLADLRESFSGRSAVLDQLSRHLDHAMLSVASADMEGLPPRDRVFELIMSRLEAMAPFRAGMLRLMKEARFDPELLALTACRLDRSLAWLQDAAHLANGSDRSPLACLRRRLQRRILTAVYLQTLASWAKDDSVDLAKTMATLDKQLRRVQGVAGLTSAERAEPEAA